MTAKYIGPIKWLGGIALLLFLFGLAFNNFSGALFSEAARSGVLVNAAPFVATFIGILLLFILLIVLVALRFNGKIPTRSYRSVEYILIGGIIAAVVCLFQPWTIVPYRYGFVLLLGSTLGFILWSHVLPGSARLDDNIPPLTTSQHVIAAAVGLIVLLALSWSAATTNAPQEPYGVRQRVWASYDEARQTEIATAAVQQFQTIEIPFLLIFNLFPASIIYFILREVIAERQRPTLRTAAVSSG